MCCSSTFSQARATDNRIFEKGMRCSKVKLGTSAILCEIINAQIYQKKHVVKITSYNPVRGVPRKWACDDVKRTDGLLFADCIRTANSVPVLFHI